MHGKVSKTESVIDFLERESPLRMGELENGVRRKQISHGRRRDRSVIQRLEDSANRQTQTEPPPEMQVLHLAQQPSCFAYSTAAEIRTIHL